MALLQTLAQLRSATRQQADADGTDALARHPDANVNDMVNRGLAALYRILVRSRGDQRYLSSQVITTVAGTTTYALNAAFMHLISMDITVDGHKYWLEAFQPNERPLLSDPNVSWTGKPFTYAIRGNDIELLPAPTGVYTVNAWFVPAPVALSSDSDATDTIARLDDYVVWYAARELATKDKAWDLVSTLSAKMGEMRSDVEAIARARDQNSPSRIVDESFNDRFGRTGAASRRRFF